MRCRGCCILARCCGRDARLEVGSACLLCLLAGSLLIHVRMPGNFLPETPTMLKSPTLPRRRRSNRVRPTTPTFLSEPDAAPPTKPVVYSPVPTIRTLGGAMVNYVKGKEVEAETKICTEEKRNWKEGKRESLLVLAKFVRRLNLLGQ